jgi:16S rRNA (cytidine1402-2'-O)-methyltransferase
MSKLYVISTPIGNIRDITLRALDVLKEVDVLLAEDTRVTAYLLSHYQIQTPIQSFHLSNEHKKVAQVISWLQEGKKVGLVSDAGTPGISDPGYLLFAACIENNIQIECLPGANALLPALIKSGFPCERFIFEGFLPHKKGRVKRIQAWLQEERTVVIYESPHRLIKSLEQIKEILGTERKLSVSREITKKFEETVNGTPDELLNYFNSKAIKGEFVIVIKGKS